MTLSRSSNNKTFLFDNITVSGRLGFGKSSLFERLKPYLEPEGFTFFSSGQLVRTETHENVQPLAKLLPGTFHQSLEEKTRTLLENNKKQVIEGWLSGFIARDLSKTLRVLVYMSDETVRIERVAQRENTSNKEAAELIKEREESNINFWHTLYGDYNFWDPTYYNLTLDTSKLGYDDCVEQVLHAFGYNK